MIAENNCNDNSDKETDTSILNAKLIKGLSTFWAQHEHDNVLQGPQKKCVCTAASNVL